MGNLITLTYPDGKQVHYEYNTANQLITVIDWAGRKTHYSYDPNARLISTKRPNGTQMTRVYDEVGQLKQQKDIVVATGEIISQFDFEYDAAGNIIEEKTSFEEPNLDINLAMTYQAANRLATYNGNAVQFDADGNMIKGPLSGELVDFTYDSRNRLIQAGSTVYRYDAENQRIGVNQTSYVVNSQPALSQVLVKTEANGTQTFYVYGLGLIGQETAGEYTSYHFDLRGSTVALTDETAQVIERFQYSPYGLLLSGDATKTLFLFNGMYGVMTDSNGLYYMRARFYSFEIRRFVNQDILLGEIIDGQILNRYAYVMGHPISFIDPYGHAPIVPATTRAWAFIEGGLTVYDGYNTIDTILDPQASSAEKWGTACLFIIGMALPGGGYTAIKAPVARHYIANITQKTFVKEKNTVIEPGVDVIADVDAIRQGLATQSGDTFTINGRTYGIHSDTGTLYPISGPGFHLLDRAAFKALGVYNKFGNSAKAIEILDSMETTEAAREAALKAWQTTQTIKP